MTDAPKITGVVLAGGRGLRMGSCDKGLLLYKGKALVSYAIDALNQITNTLFINANRNHEAYQAFGYPIITDENDAFEGPLAGLLSAMRSAKTPYVLTLPCDSPLIKGHLLQRLYDRLTIENAEICVAHDGERAHPVFMLVKTELHKSLEAYLKAGDRKIDLWLKKHACVWVDYSDHPELFTNINTPEDLAALEKMDQKSMNPVSIDKNIVMTHAGLSSSHKIDAFDENGETVPMELVGELALTIYLDKHEIVTLMTMGGHPECLVLGYLRNQGFIENIEDVLAVQVDWQTEAAAVVTQKKDKGFLDKLAQRTVTSGCGQGTVFGRMIDKLKQISLPETQIKQSEIYKFLHALREHNEIYKRVGAVHGCALGFGECVEIFIEDVGRHNAVDAIAGHMWLNDISGTNKIFYTTGRLTSEMVIKVAQMGIPILLSRSGATQMGLDMARIAGVTLISRAKGRHFLVLNGEVIFDAKPNMLKP